MTWSKLLHDPVGFLWDAVRNRGVRLTIYLIVVAVVFPSSRAILTAVLVLTLAVLWIRDYQKFGSRKIYYLAVCLGLFVAGYCAAWLDVKRVNELRLARSPWGEGINLVQNGTYTGSGEGFRGPIEVKVEVRDHRIAGVTMVAYPDLISVKDTEIRNLQSKILETGQLVRPGEPAMLRGAQQTLTGYTTAIESALTKGIPDYPHYNLFSRVVLGATLGNAPNRVTLNSLAILFAAFLVFEYALQSMLTPGTGRSINCYNCASCVGACPVKEAEGVQFPMGLVLLTRLGEYERVTELSKYCVGCGRCAAKCPIGNSGPLVISAAYQACTEMKRKKALVEQEETGLMGRVTAYIIALIVVLAFVGLAADISTRSATCMVCHQQQADYAHWMTQELKAKNKGFSHELIACAACHIEGAAAGTTASRFRGLLHAVTYVIPQIDPREPLTPRLFKKARIPSENCLYCHAGAVNRRTVWVKDLPKGLRPIGLTMDHRKHLLTGEDTCGRCHERYKDKKEETADKTVNYAEVNHLACDACHTAASHAYLGDRMLGWTEPEFHQAREEAWKQMAGNPRWMISIPTEKTCGRCHNGKIHFKTKIFEANCRTGSNYDNCVKCHPLMTREYFDNYRQQQSKVTSTSHDEDPEG